MGFNRASFECMNSITNKTLWTYWTRDNIASAANIVPNVIGNDATPEAITTYWNSVPASFPNVATGDLILAVQEENAGSAVLSGWLVKNSSPPNSSSMLRVL